MKWMRYTARTIIVLWAGFWVLFVVGEAITGGGHYGGGNGKEALKGILALGAILLIIAGGIYLAWRRELVAGISLMLISLLVLVAYFLRFGASLNLSKMAPVLLIMVLPLLVAGLLFLISVLSKRMSPPSQ
jgi:hypothetical protein